MITNGLKYLITSNEWFMTPDGYQCKAAWGVCKIVTTEQLFGFTPQRPSTNWFLQIGDGEKSIIIAGCHIHYAIQCAKKPKKINDWYKEKGCDVNSPVNKIYFTQ